VTAGKARGQLSPGPALRHSSQAANPPHPAAGMLRQRQKATWPQSWPLVMARANLGSDRIRKTNSTDCKPQQRTSGRRGRGLYSAEANRRTEAILAENARSQPGSRARPCCLDRNSPATRTSASNAIALPSIQRSPWLILNSHTPQGGSSTAQRPNASYRMTEPQDARWPIPGAQRARYTSPSQPQNRENHQLHFPLHPTARTLQKSGNSACDLQIPLPADGDLDKLRRQASKAGGARLSARR